MGVGRYSGRRAILMASKKTAVWVTLLTSGLGVALLTFMADKGWEFYQHRNVGPEHVYAALRLEDNKVFVFLRNNSDEPLDFKRATIFLSEPTLVDSQAFAAYPDITKVYTATATSGSANVDVVGKQLVVTLHITQSIAPKGADHFGVALAGLAGPLDLSKATVRAELEDLKGKKYVVTH